MHIRMGQFKKLGEMILAMEEEYLEAVQKDMMKHPVETSLTDIKAVQSELGVYYVKMVHILT